MKAANNAPVFCCLYPDFAEIAREHGYAMAVHGSLAKDFDLICIPWVETASEPIAVVTAITSRFAIELVSGPNKREHGREVFTITIYFGECYLDLSFMPRCTAQPGVAA